MPDSNKDFDRHLNSMRNRILFLAEAIRRHAGDIQHRMNTTIIDMDDIINDLNEQKMPTVHVNPLGELQGAGATHSTEYGRLFTLMDEYETLVSLLNDSE